MKYPVVDPALASQAIRGEIDSWNSLFTVLSSVTNELRGKFLEINKDEEQQEVSHSLTFLLSLWHFSMLDALIHTEGEPSEKHLEMALTILHRRLNRIANGDDA